MKQSLFLFIIFLSTILVSNSCKKEIEVDFHFTLDYPKIGDSIGFVNTSSGGEDYNWNFGDGETSEYRSPTHVYNKTGTYTVTLMVNRDQDLMRSKQITVYDSIPSISRDIEMVHYFEDIKFKAIAFNPYKKTVKHQWLFSNAAQGKTLRDTVVNDVQMKVSYDAQPIVFYKDKDVEERVSLDISIGESVYTSEQIENNVFYINERIGRGLLIARGNEPLLRQRIFENGGAEPTVFKNIPSGKHPFNITIYEELLYIFDAGTNIEKNNNWENDKSGDGNIRMINLNDGVEKTIIHNKGKSSYFGFYNGFADRYYVYWNDYNNFAYRLRNNNTETLTFEWKGENEQHAVPYYLASAGSLGIPKDQFNGSIQPYGTSYFWAKGGDAKGIYIFPQEGQANTVKVEHILANKSIRTFAIDPVFMRIYFSVTAPSDSVGLYVSDIHGKNTRRIDNPPIDNEKEYITGIVVDNTANKVYWAYRAPQGLSEEYFKTNPSHRSGLKQITLIGDKNTHDKIEIKNINNIENIYGIALDNKER